MSKEITNNNCYSPFEIAKMIDSNEFVLPRFQRELDWKTDRIAKLFDSIYKGYYINIVVLWKPEINKPNYSFIKDYCYGMHNSEDIKDISCGKSFVLDGQQRFEAFYIGLYGSYKEKSGVLKELYFYLTSHGKSDDFAFVSENEYRERNINKIFMIKVSDLRKYSDKNKVIGGLIDCINDEIKQNKNLLLSNNIKKKDSVKLSQEIDCYNEKINVINNEKDRILKLYDKLHEKSIMYYYVDNSLDDESIEELFVRMNTGGNQLSSAEIILSKLSTKWKRNARKEINKLIDDINNFRVEDDKNVYDFSINLDFVMKAMLVLLDRPNVSFRLNEILKDDLLIDLMEKKFENIGFALKNAFAFVNAYGFNHSVLRSNNAIIPIAYLLYTKNLYSKNSKFFLEDKKFRNLQKSMIRWLCVTILSGFWSGANDTRLLLIRKTIVEYKGKTENFDFYRRLKDNDEIATFMKIDKKDVNTILKNSYNSPLTYSVLCILYLNNFKSYNYIRQHYDVDHIFPKSKFNEEYLSEMNINGKKRKFYMDNYNLLPNLQLLTEKENRTDKRDKNFDEWILEFYKNDDIQSVLDANYIDKIYKFNQFEAMFKKRKAILTDELLKIFK